MARLSAMPKIEMRIMGPENEDPSSFLEISRLAIKKPVLMDEPCMQFSKVQKILRA
jgi:hypothetical protein